MKLTDALQELINDLGQETVGRLFKIYKQESQERFQAIEQHILSQNFNQIECESHALKSASYHFGLDQIGDPMALIEKAANEENIAAIKDIFHKAKRSYKTVPEVLFI